MFVKLYLNYVNLYNNRKVDLLPGEIVNKCWLDVVPGVIARVICFSPAELILTNL